MSKPSLNLLERLYWFLEFRLDVWTVRTNMTSVKTKFISNGRAVFIMLWLYTISPLYIAIPDRSSTRLYFLYILLELPMTLRIVLLKLRFMNSYGIRDEYIFLCVHWTNRNINKHEM